LISDSGIPFAANPWKIAGKLLNDWRETARLNASRLASALLEWSELLSDWLTARFAVASIVIHLTFEVRLCRMLIASGRAV
jgi:hypothetical protein